MPQVLPGVEYQVATAPNVDLGSLLADTAADLGSLPVVATQDENMDADGGCNFLALEEAAEAGQEFERWKYKRTGLWPMAF